MPSLQKKVLSRYIRTGCERQLLLNLYNDTERKQRGMPPRQTERAGIGYAGVFGYEWQDKKVSELDQVFGAANVHVNPQMSGNRPGSLELDTVLAQVKPFQFVVEGRYSPDTATFRNSINLDTLFDLKGEPLTVGDAFPDIIQILPSMADRAGWEIEREEARPGAIGLAHEVTPCGDIRPLNVTDTRLRLRIIDIKLAAEPGAHYFAEVVYYSLTFAAWLAESPYSDQYVVVAAPAVWPGSYEASAIVKACASIRQELRDPTAEELALALEDDIEIAPFDVFGPRLTQFFREDLPRVLQTQWDQLPWHVSVRCSGCEFLGYPWQRSDGKPTNDLLHCWPTAQREGHLSRVVGLTRGNARQLASIAPDVATLATTSIQNTAFDASPTLRAKRTVFPHRAKSLYSGDAGIIPASGSDALMPEWPDLRIFIFLDYDLSSAITASLSLRAYWKEPLPFESTLTPVNKKWLSRSGAVEDKDATLLGSDKPFQEVFIIDRRDLMRERDELLKFLRSLRGILDGVRNQDEQDAASNRRGDTDKPDKLKRSTYQIYLWDEAQRKHLVRVVGRHLDAILADPKLRDLAWLFPPAELLVHPEDASYNSPFTLVSSVVQNTVAVPVPHRYTLLEVVQTYRPEGSNAPFVHPLYQDPLSDLIPSERIHEMWTQRGDWLETANEIRQTTRRKLVALSLVTGQLWRDLKTSLTRAAAPHISRPSRGIQGVAPQSQVWYEYTRLNYALDELEEHSTRAMPAHEREARAKSAHLHRRLEGDKREQALLLLQAASEEPLEDPDELIVYEMSKDSVEFNVRPPQMGFALAPRLKPEFLNTASYPLVKDLDLKVGAKLSGSVADAGLTQVSVIALDRPNLLLALRPGRNYRASALESAGRIDLSHDVMLDPVGADYLSKKVRLTLEGIGWPQSAQDNEAALHALGMKLMGTPQVIREECPASEFLWQSAGLVTTPVLRDIQAAKAKLEHAGIRLNDSQWSAWSAALSRRLTLIWGPPGTGKSQTLRAVVAGAVCAAHQLGTPLRVLISAGTYTAVDNVLLDTAKILRSLLPVKPYQIIRLQSDYNTPPKELADDSDIVQVVVKTVQAPQYVLDLQSTLNEPSGIVIVGAVPQQLHNLAVATKNKQPKNVPSNTQRRWFDLILIDEASQIGMAESTLIVSKGSNGAAFVLAGDDLQLPPIHPAQPPENLSHVVGSVYGYLRHYHRILPEPLQVNYRSCQALVEFTLRAGYDPSLHAHHSALRLALLKGEALPHQRPSDWPDTLHWTADWGRLLNPDSPAACFVYVDEVASQANDFEADAVAALLYLLYQRTDSQLAGEKDNNGQENPLSGKPYGMEDFWKHAVGVVTPHRAQMAKVVARLQNVFPGHDASLIWQAVDTVERFQGQQRDVIIASFGLGDPDLIQAEDEFLYSLNRFNVMASRARAKLIVLTTRSLVNYLSDNADVLEQSRLFKYFVETFCCVSEPLTLAYLDATQQVQHRSGVLRTR